MSQCVGNYISLRALGGGKIAVLYVSLLESKITGVEILESVGVSKCCCTNSHSSLAS